jgi:hypothetical protein
MLFQLTEQRDKHNKAEYAYESDYTQIHYHINQIMFVYFHVRKILF